MSSIIHGMGHSREEKARSHERIVEIAAARLRESGTAGPGVAELMKEAGLTHGGFYKHFGSRDDLVAEAVERALRENEDFVTTLTAGAADSRAALDLFVDWYTSAGTPRQPGCGVRGGRVRRRRPACRSAGARGVRRAGRALPHAPGGAARRPRTGRGGAEHARRRRPRRAGDRPRRAVGRDPRGGADDRAGDGQADRPSVDRPTTGSAGAWPGWSTDGHRLSAHR